MLGEWRPQTSLIALWHMENVNDSSGSGFTLTNTNTVSFNQAKFALGADFGTGDHNRDLRISSNLGLVGTQDMTFSFWMKLNTEIGVGSYHIFSHETTLTTARYLFFEYQYNGGSRQLSANVAGTTTTYAVTLGTTNWYHITYVRASNVPSIYVNGNLVATGTAGSSTSSDNRVFLGRQTDGNNDAAIILDEFAVFSKALTLHDLTEYYGTATGRW